VNPTPPDTRQRFTAEQEHARWQRARAIMNEMLQRNGLAGVAGDKVLVTELKRRPEAGWQHAVETFAARIPIQGR
jgi:hypothetical protein